MFGTNKLCMKGIYLPTFQRSIILWANEGYKKITQLFTVRQPLEGKTCFITCVFIYIIYRFYTDFSLFRQIKRHDTVLVLTSTFNLYQSYRSLLLHQPLIFYKFK
jgi:hypothetical protein